MPSSVSLRPFVAADAPELTNLLHESYLELGRQGMNFTAIDQTVKTTIARVERGRCWVVEHGDLLVGSITMTFPPSPSVRRLSTEARLPERTWLNQLAVHPTMRRRGLASLLWRHGREWAREQGATTIGLDTAAPASHLISMYSSWGFAAVEHIHWPGKTYDSVVMTRALRPNA